MAIVLQSSYRDCIPTCALEITARTAAMPKHRSELERDEMNLTRIQKSVSAIVCWASYLKSTARKQREPAGKLLLSEGLKSPKNSVDMSPDPLGCALMDYILEL